MPLALSGMVCFQGGAALATPLLVQIGPAAGTLLRLFLAAAILCVLSPPRWRHLEAGQLRAAILYGIALGVMNLGLYESIDRIPLSSSITIQFIGPLAVALFARKRMLDIFWVLLAALGIVALVGPSVGDGSAVGYMFAAGAGAAWGFYILLSARLGSTFDDTSGLALGLLVACLVPLGPALAQLPQMSFGPELLPLGLAIALLSSVIPHMADVQALRRLPPNVFGILMSMEPVIACFIGLVFLSQVPALHQWVGIVAVVVAAVGVLRNQPVIERGDHI